VARNRRIKAKEPILRRRVELVFKQPREEAGGSRSKEARFQPRLHGSAIPLRLFA